jgi:uncharacterized protein YeaO (DUF488 family)
MDELVPLTTPGEIRTRRVYETPASADGFRALVDRLWPRGLTKQQAAVDAWVRDVAPSTALRQWYHRDRTRWAEFSTRYRAELREREDELEALALRALKGRVTLLYAARETERNHALVLAEVLRPIVDRLGGRALSG